MGIKNKVILFFPEIDRSNFWIPLSVFSLVPIVKSEGLEPIIIDGNIEKDPYRILFKHLNDAICVGISCKIGNQIKSAIEVSQLIKAKDPELPIIWGGPLPTLDPELVLSLPYVDAVVIGQGQLTLKDILKALRKGRSLKGIKGVNFKDKGTIIRNNKRPITPIKLLPSVQYDESTKKYLRHTVAPKIMMYNSSEGCPHRCTFCTVSEFFNSRWYAQEADKVVEDLEKIKSKTGAEGIFFCDPNFFADTKRVNLICQKFIEKNLGLKWIAYGRVDQFVRFRPRFVKLLKESGFSELIVGAESGAQCVLDYIKKNTLTKEIMQLADLCSQQGIYVKFSFMVGFPGTARQIRREIDATLNISKKIINKYPDHEVHWNCYKPLSSQEMTIVQKYGFKKPSRIEDWISLGDFSLVDSPWISKDTESFLDALINYYTFILKPLRVKRQYLGREPTFIENIRTLLAKQRMNNNFLSVPFEYWINKNLKMFGKNILHILQNKMGKKNITEDKNFFRYQNC